MILFVANLLVSLFNSCIIKIYYYTRNIKTSLRIIIERAIGARNYNECSFYDQKYDIC